MTFTVQDIITAYVWLQIGALVVVPILTYLHIGIVQHREVTLAIVIVVLLPLFAWLVGFMSLIKRVWKEV